MVSIPEHPLSFKWQGCELRKSGDETQKSRTEMKLLKRLAFNDEDEFHIQLSIVNAQLLACAMCRAVNSPGVLDRQSKLRPCYYS